MISETTVARLGGAIDVRELDRISPAVGRFPRHERDPLARYLESLMAIAMVVGAVVVMLLAILAFSVMGLILLGVAFITFVLHPEVMAIITNPVGYPNGVPASRAPTS